jgi:hypothetical protein
MKKILKPLVFSVILLASVAFAQITLAQAPPPPPPPSGKGTTGNQGPANGGGAPIEGGLIVSLALIAGFGGWKWYRVTREKKQTA